MNVALVSALLAGATLAAAGAVFVESDVRSAGERLKNPPEQKPEEKAAIADHTEAAYCTPQFKEVLQRVLNACGLLGAQDRRGCQPADVKNFGAISDADFVALFTPLKDRGAVIMFDEGQKELDEAAKKLVVEQWNDRRGARYFFMVARASKQTGTPQGNQKLSHERANSVKFHLDEATKDPDLEKQVGMLWLGSEYAQLPKEYCADWKKSRPNKPCDSEAINRSAFVSWVDCRL
jgi:outer membrane protein OmpA-like peptidoglycan-associated protein